MASEPDDELVVVVPAAHQAGVWANDAIVHAGDHEVTVDLLRVDHSVEPEIGTVVARVAMSPKLLRQLIDELTGAWDAYVAGVTDRLIEPTGRPEPRGGSSSRYPRPGPPRSVGSMEDGAARPLRPAQPAPHRRPARSWPRSSTGWPSRRRRGHRR